MNNNEDKNNKTIETQSTQKPASPQNSGSKEDIEAMDDSQENGDGLTQEEAENPVEPEVKDDEEETETTGEMVPATYDELEIELAGVKDQLLRALAETENVRQRAEREKSDASKYAITNFARDIISVADNLVRALDSVNEESRKENEELNNLYIGIEMTDKELVNTLEQFNIKAVDSVGSKFDHNIHQAMFEVDDASQPAGIVVEEVQKGYMLHDRLLRPAMVGVSKGGDTLDEERIDEEPSGEQHDAPINHGSSAYEKRSEAVTTAAEKVKIDRKL